MSASFKNLSRFFIYTALLSPLIILKSIYFPFIYGKVLLFRVSVELALFFFILHLLTDNSFPAYRRILTHPITIAVTMFAFLFVITTVTGISPHSSFWSNFERGEGGFQMLHYLAFFLLTALLFSARGQWQSLLGFSVIVSLVILAYGLGQWLHEFGIENFTIKTGGRVSGTLGNPSYLNAYLLFHLTFILWLLIKASPAARWFWGTILTLGTVLFFTTETLAAIFGLIVAGTVAVFLYGAVVFKRYHGGGSVNLLTVYYPYLGGLLLVVIVAGSLFFINNQNNLYDRLKPRLWTWGSALAGIKERPWLGWGTENFPAVFDKYYNPNHFGGEDWFDRTHNLFLEYLIAGGIPLLMTYLTIYAAYYWQLFKKEKDWLWPVFAVLPLAYLIQGSTLFEVLPVYLALFLFLAFFLHYRNNFLTATAGAATNTTSPSRWVSTRTGIFDETSVVSNLLKVAMLAVALLILWLIYYGNYLPLKKNLLLSEALRAGNITEAVGKFRVALAFPSPVGQEETYESAGRSFISYLDGLIQQKVAVAAENPKLKEIMELNQQTFAQLQPRLVNVKNFYVNGIWNFTAYKLTREPAYLAEAKAMLEEARRISPNRLRIIVSLFNIAHETGDEKAQQELSVIINRLRPDLIIRFQAAP